MKNFQKYVNDHTWICMYGMLLEGLEPSYLDETPMLFIKLQERWGGVWVGGWRYFDGDNLGGADGTFACKRRQLRWSIKEWWAVMSHKVYRNPRPKSIDAVMRRVAEAVRTADQNVLTKMVQQLPAKMNEIFRQKAKRIPSNFEASKSPFACKCAICSS